MFQYTFSLIVIVIIVIRISHLTYPLANTSDPRIWIWILSSTPKVSSLEPLFNLLTWLCFLGDGLFNGKWLNGGCHQWSNISGEFRTQNHIAKIISVFKSGVREEQVIFVSFKFGLKFLKLFFNFLRNFCLIILCPETVVFQLYLKCLLVRLGQIFRVSGSYEISNFFFS